MAVKLRLMRMGKKKQPTYRIVASDSRSPRDGRFIEIVGTYAPRQDPSAIDIDNARAVAWLTNGAKPSDTVRKLLELSGAWGEYAAQLPEKKEKPARKRKASKKAAAKKVKKAPPTKAPAKKAPAKKAAPVAVEDATPGEAEETAPEPEAAQVSETPMPEPEPQESEDDAAAEDDPPMTRRTRAERDVF